MSDILYALVYAKIEGALLTQEASVSVRRMTNAQVVKTVALGFAGVSPGAPMMELDISNAVPAADFEYDAGPAMLALKTVEICLEGAGRQMISKFFITEDSTQHAVDSPSKYDFKCVGRFGVWQ